MTIVDDWVAFDTNIYIFGIRETPQFPACVELLEGIGELHVYVPRQIIRELQKNLQPDEVHELFELFNRYSDRVKISWLPAALSSIEKFVGLGCKLGDAAVAAHLQELGVRCLITENRHFLTEIHGLPFSILSPAEALEALNALGK